MKRLILSLFILALAATQLDAGPYDSTRYRFGVWGDYYMNFHYPKLNHIEGITAQPADFSSLPWLGYAGGVVFEYPLLNDFLISFKLGHYAKNGIVVLESASDQTIYSYLNIVGLEPTFKYRLFDEFYFNFGYTIGVLYDAKYKLDLGYKGIDLIDGEFNNAYPLYADIAAGFGYDIFFNDRRTFLITPEVSYSVGLTDVSEDGYWKVNSFRAGLSFKYSPAPTIYATRERFHIDTVEKKSIEYIVETIEPGVADFEKRIVERGDSVLTIWDVYRTDTLFVPKPTTAATMEVYGKLLSGELTPVNSILIKTRQLKEVFPLLIQIFFDSKSTNIPSRYEFVENKDYFDIEELNPNPLSYHKNLLNIIGYRMEQKTGTEINLIGFADPNTEENLCPLANKRAEKIAAYLNEILGIDKSRIIPEKQKKNCYPADAFKINNLDYFAENRNVSLYGSVSALKPIELGFRKEALTVAPEEIIFDFSASDFSQIDYWNFKLKQGDFVFYDIKGDGETKKIKYAFQKELVEYLDFDRPITAEFYAFNERGEYTSATKSLNLVIDSINQKVTSLKFVLFDYGESDLTEKAKTLIGLYWNDIQRAEHITIKGYADKYERQFESGFLPLERALNAAYYIRQKLPTAVVKEAVAGDEKQPDWIDSQDLPEERKLSRTVEIRLFYTIDGL